MKHTPGPWHIGDERPWKGHVYGPDGIIVAAIGYNYMNAEGNRPLIAAAPDMLEVLKTIENDNEQIPSWLWRSIQVVIGKAEGR